jgi:hypothetical protein
MVGMLLPVAIVKQSLLCCHLDAVPQFETLPFWFWIMPAEIEFFFRES